MFLFSSFLKSKPKLNNNKNNNNISNNNNKSNSKDNNKSHKSNKTFSKTQILPFSNPNSSSSSPTPSTSSPSPTLSYSRFTSLNNNNNHSISSSISDSKISYSSKPLFSPKSMNLKKREPLKEIIVSKSQNFQVVNKKNRANNNNNNKSNPLHFKQLKELKGKIQSSCSKSFVSSRNSSFFNGSSFEAEEYEEYEEDEEDDSSSQFSEDVGIDYSDDEEDEIGQENEKTINNNDNGEEGGDEVDDDDDDEIEEEEIHFDFNKRNQTHNHSIQNHQHFQFSNNHNDDDGDDIVNIGKSPIEEDFDDDDEDEDEDEDEGVEEEVEVEDEDEGLFNQNPNPNQSQNQNHNVQFPIFWDINKDYNDKIIEYLKENENKYSASYNRLKNQKHITTNHRAILINWMNEVSDFFKLKRRTYQLSVNYFDRILEKTKNIRLDQSQLIAFTCLFIASKYEEISPIELKNYCDVNSEHKISDVIRAEKKLLNILEFRLTITLIDDFLFYYLVKLIGLDQFNNFNFQGVENFNENNSKDQNDDEDKEKGKEINDKFIDFLKNNQQISKIYYLSKFIVDSSLMHYDTFKFDYSTIALSSLMISFNTILGIQIFEQGTQSCIIFLQKIHEYAFRTNDPKKCYSKVIFQQLKNCDVTSIQPKSRTLQQVQEGHYGKSFLKTKNSKYKNQFLQKIRYNKIIQIQQQNQQQNHQQNNHQNHQQNQQQNHQQNNQQNQRNQSMEEEEERQEMDIEEEFECHEDINENERKVFELEDDPSDFDEFYEFEDDDESDEDDEDDEDDEFEYE